MKNLIKEIKLSNRINESISRLYKELVSSSYSVDFHKGDGDYYLDINCSNKTLNYIVYNRTKNTVSFSQVVDDVEKVYAELNLEDGVPNYILMRLVERYVTN